jgi:hypothetical protein
MEVRHLARELKTALELAIAALAPTDLVEKLAVTSGLLDALAEFPADTPPVVQLVPKTFERARRALEEWRQWQGQHVPRVLA